MLSTISTIIMFIFFALVMAGGLYDAYEQFTGKKSLKKMAEQNTERSQVSIEIELRKDINENIEERSKKGFSDIKYFYGDKEWNVHDKTIDEVAEFYSKKGFKVNLEKQGLKHKRYIVIDWS